MKKLALIPLVVLAACTSVHPVTGQMQRSDETFTGSVEGSGYSGGSGELTLVSSRKGVCRGSFVYTSRRKGNGVLTCDDGRSGPFFISGVQGSGNGYGELSGQRYTFTFVPPD